MFLEQAPQFFVYISVLSESLARPLWQPAGAGIQHERRASDAGDDVTAIRQEALVRAADRCDVRGSKTTEHDRVHCQDVVGGGGQTADVTCRQ